MNLGDLRKQSSEKWSALSAARKSAVAVMGMAVIVALIYLYQGTAATQYAPLWNNMEPKNASAVVESLKEQGVKYRLADQGTSVLVPEERVYELRLQMASDGVMPTSGTGFELFDQNQLGMTDFERHLNYQRALQEELRRTIVAMEEVEQARVHLVIPEPSVFIDEQQQASASVVIKLKPLAEIDTQQIWGIVSLVAGSVENLSADNVNVIDMSGNILSEQVAAENSLAGSSLKQQEMKRQFEQHLEDRIERMLQAIFGPGKAVAMVTAELDFNEHQMTRIDYGEDGVVTSEQIIRENSSSQTETAAGAPGADSNMSVYPAMENTGDSTSQSKESISREYQVDQQQETVVYAPGTLERLSSAVTVDGPLTEQQVTQIKELVTAATGYHPDRGDQITVMSMAFDKSYVTQTQQAMQQQAADTAKQQQQRQYITAGLTALALILVFIIIMVVLRRGRPAGLDATIEDMVPIQDISTEPVISPEEQRSKEKKKKLREIVQDSPAEAVQMVKAWLEES